jgi:hypothetical protein
MRFILPLVFPSIILASATCYFRNGDVAPNAWKPCNINATGVTNSHSACCDTGNNDVCLQSGLCLYPGSAFGNGFSLFFANGCTDKNLQDSSCQTFCPSTTASTQQILNCGNGKFCCADANKAANATACCGGHTFTLANGIGVPNNQTSSTIVSIVTEIPAGSGSTENKTVVAAVGSVLGALLAASLAAIAFLIWKLRGLQHGLGGTILSPSGATARVEIGKDPAELQAVPAGPFELSERQG